METSSYTCHENFLNKQKLHGEQIELIQPYVVNTL